MPAESEQDDWAARKAAVIQHARDIFTNLISQVIATGKLSALDANETYAAVANTATCAYRCAEAFNAYTVERYK